MRREPGISGGTALGFLIGFVLFGTLLLTTSFAESDELSRSEADWFYRSIWQTIFGDSHPVGSDNYNQALAFVGREDLAGDDIRPGNTAFCASGLPDGIVWDTIRDVAAGSRVVIINEAHDRPDHRAFVAELAHVLGDEGFSYYAAEAFENPGTDENAFTIIETPDMASGWYVREPVFGRLVGGLQAIGYTLAGYDSVAASGARKDTDPLAEITRREEDQANSLVTLIESMPQDEKLLIHVGYGHGAEEPIETGADPILMMGARLKAKTGIDPVTIDQTMCEGAGEDVLLKGLQPVGYDMTIARARLDFIYHRPTWRLAAGDRLVAIPQSIFPDTGPVIVEARMENAPNDTVPTDRVLVREGEDTRLLLPPGRYAVRGYNLEDGFSSSETIGVE
ncbi:hypothetical protein FF098_012645 [Parvularcula flava]|uniref:Uncharacterized protein n=1 Tax=Aquisalinus luteolus TaxID=1566827 RepID=A0A8J3A897_9PROT|nr:hypothetical protein [Aquisalinus luteolus]NHK28761.1 hypothetical protein [Aquisalinus luteolus]GGH99440.1 hypothetical protein GCM10011355_25400 [Aquisalinus luteolus]